MALYDDRLADLSERRLRSRHAARFSPPTIFRPRRSPVIERPKPEAARKKPTKVQALLFDRSAGWTPSKAKAWAKAHGYKHGKVHTTSKNIRIRQLDPKKFKTKRTITFGRGIKAVVARESIGMAKGKTVKSSRRKVSAPRRRRKRRSAAPAPKRRRRRRRVAAPVAQAPRRRRRRRASTVMAPRRRRRVRRRRTREAWRGDAGGHRKAARKGWRRKKERTVRRRRRRASEPVMEAPRRRRRRSRRRTRETVRSHRPRRMFARRGGGMGAAELVLMMASAGFGYTLADGLDRFLATYNPSAAERPKDKFTSDGTGMLGNTLNVASMPGLVRAGAAIGMVAAPTTAALMMRDSIMKRAAEGMAIGAGVSAVKSLVANVVMPLLIGKDTSVPTMQKSFIARLYPAEVAASINMKAKQTAVSSAGSGALSGRDVGPFALQGDSPYPTAEQALRAGVSGDSPYPSAAEALRREAGMGGDSPYPTADQALRREAGMSEPWQPGPPAPPGPGPQAPGQEDCGCVGEGHAYYGLGDGPEEQDQLFTTQ